MHTDRHGQTGRKTYMHIDRQGDRRGKEIEKGEKGIEKEVDRHGQNR